MSDPSAIAVDSDGNLFIADTGNNVIRAVKGGTITTVAGNYIDGPGYSGDNGLATSAQLNSPSGVAVDQFGNIYIADTANSVIREVAAQMIFTIAGNGNYGYSGDGSQATAAELADPFGVAVDGSGNVEIADTYNNVVREVSVLPNSMPPR